MMFKFEAGESYKFTYDKGAYGWGSDQTETRLVFVTSCDESKDLLHTYDYVKQGPRFFSIQKIQKPEKLKQKSIRCDGLDGVISYLIDGLTDNDYYVYKTDDVIYAVKADEVVDKYPLVPYGNGTLAIGPINISFTSNGNVILYHENGKFTIDSPTGQDVIDALLAEIGYKTPS